MQWPWNRFLQCYVYRCAQYDYAIHVELKAFLPWHICLAPSWQKASLLCALVHFVNGGCLISPAERLTCKMSIKISSNMLNKRDRHRMYYCSPYLDCRFPVLSRQCRQLEVSSEHLLFELLYSLDVPHHIWTPIIVVGTVRIFQMRLVYSISMKASCGRFECLIYFPSKGAVQVLIVPLPNILFSCRHMPSLPFSMIPTNNLSNL